MKIVAGRFIDTQRRAARSPTQRPIYAPIRSWQNPHFPSEAPLTKSQADSIAIFAWMTLGVVVVTPAAVIGYWIVGLIARAFGVPA